MGVFVQSGYVGDMWAVCGGYVGSEKQSGNIDVDNGGGLWYNAW